MSNENNDRPTSGADAETREPPTLLYPGFPVLSLSDFLRDIPDRWRIWYAREG